MNAQRKFSDLAIAVVLASTLALPALGIPTVGGSGNNGDRPDVGSPGDTSTATNNTTFACVNDTASGGEYATVAITKKGRTPPMIVWRTYSFGSDYTPAYRCQAVSDRLNRAIAANGGKLSNLWLTTGNVNRQTVICYVNQSERCNANNVLFTLKPENARRAGDILARLLRFSQSGSGGAIFESENAAPTRVSLEEVVNGAFESGGTANPAGNTNSNPNSGSGATDGI
jgi:hypothetical protein